MAKGLLFEGHMENNAFVSGSQCGSRLTDRMINAHSRLDPAWIIGNGLGMMGDVYLSAHNPELVGRHYLGRDAI